MALLITWRKRADMKMDRTHCCRTGHAMMGRKVHLSTILLTVLILAMVGNAFGQPVIVDPAWTLIRTIDVTDPMAANFNPLDGQIYFGKRASGSDGLYRIDNFGFSEKLASGSNVAAVAVEPGTGHIYFSEDYGGGVYRTEFGGTGRATWLSGFRSGDDDPIGMAFAPPGHSSGVLQPGEALVVDRGNGGYDVLFHRNGYHITIVGEIGCHRIPDNNRVQLLQLDMGPQIVDGHGLELDVPLNHFLRQSILRKQLDRFSSDGTCLGVSQADVDTGPRQIG